MRGVAESLVFAGAAIALHLALWPADPDSGVEAAGGGGEALLTMRASSAALAAQVAEWDRTPEPVTEAPAAPQMPDLASLAPPPPIAEPAPPPETPRPPAAMQMQTSPLPMTPGVEPPPPPPSQRPRPAPQPELRPAEAAASRSSPRPPETDSKPPEVPQKTLNRPAPSAPSVAQAAQRAKGAGGEARGQSGQAKAATLSPAQSRALMAEWGAQIRARIARGVPRGAGQGTAVISLTVAADGSLLTVRLAKSSGNARIDQLALAAVRQAGRLPAAPAALGLRQQSFTLPVQSR